MCDCTGSPCFPASQPQRQARRWCGGGQWGGKSASQSPRFGFCFNCWQNGHFLTASSNTRNPDLVRQWLLASSSRSRDPAHRQPENSQWLLRCRANERSPLYQGPKKIKFQRRVLESYLNTDDKSQCPKPCRLNHDHMDRQTSQDGFRGLKSWFRLLMG